MVVYMTKSRKINRKKQRKNRTIRRKCGGGVSSSKQKNPMDELNTIESRKKNMMVYEKLVAIENLAPGFIGIDFTKDPTRMRPAELNKSLAILGIKTTENEKDEIVKLLKKAYKSSSNPKIDKVLDETIATTRENLVKEEEKHRQIKLQKQRENEEKHRIKQERHLREEQRKIDEFDAKVKEAQEWDKYNRQMEEMSNPRYSYSQNPYAPNPYAPNPYVSAAIYNREAQEELNQIPQELRYGFTGKNDARLFR
jgi:hypothetical protein